MKSKFLKYLFVTGLGLTMILFSCTKLDEKVYSELIAEQFNPTESDVASVMGPIYSNLRNVVAGWAGLYDVVEESSDLIVTPVRPNGWDDGGMYRRMHKHTWTPEEYHTGALWNRIYSGVNHANRALYMIESGQLPIATGKENYIAEIKVARAFYYYLLLDNFGNVPIVTQFDVPDGFLPTQSTRKQVYDFVESEIKSNIELLSEANDPTTYGRFNKWAAYTILAKIYLNAQVYTGTPQWTACIDACNKVLTSGKYQLEPVYSDLFKTNNEGSTETVFAVPFDDIYGPWLHWHMKTLHPLNQTTYNLLESPWGGSCAIPQFINTYSPNDKRLAQTWIRGQQFSSNGDSLFCNLGADKMGLPLNFINFVQSADYSAEDEGYRMGKYEIKMGAKGQLSNDVPFFRLADVMMMKAECLLRTGDASGAASIVTEVRRRSFDNSADAIVTGAQLQGNSAYNYGFVENGVITEPDKTGSIQFGRFLDELGWEFVAELHRRSDLIRFGVYTTKTWLSHRPNGAYRSLFPIPQDQLNNNTNLKQNTGY
jgi:starch-binding outer membrane protein, SusD/RagB family